MGPPSPRISQKAREATAPAGITLQSQEWPAPVIHHPKLPCGKPLGSSVWAVLPCAPDSDRLSIALPPR